MATRSLSRAVGIDEVTWLIGALRARYGSGGSAAPATFDLDWRLVRETARRHAVLQLIPAAIQEEPALHPPEAERADIEREAREVSLESMSRTRQLIELLDRLSGAGVPTLAYKGPVLAQVVYGDVGLRSFGDLDLLIQPDRVHQAIAVLNQAGYEALAPCTERQLRHLIRTGHDFPMGRADDGMVELQWAIGSRAHVIPRRLGPLFDRAKTVQLAGRDVRSLDPTDQLVVVAIHGSIHLWSRLGWVCDFVECAGLDGVDLPAALRLAEGVRSRRMLLLAVAMAERVLGVRVDDSLAVLARDDPSVEALARTLEQALLSPGGPDRRASQARVASRVRLSDNLVDGLLGAWRAIVTPNQSDWEALRLPDQLLALYYPVRLIRAVGFALGLGRSNRHDPDVFDAH